MICEKQMPEKYREVIKKQLEKFKRDVITEQVDKIPNVKDIPTEKSDTWLKIKDVICVFVDMKNSTKLSASQHPKNTAKVYTLFTGTAVRLFKCFGASYIDIKGDGVFALFNYDQVHSAFSAAVTFKTFVKEEFTTKVSNKTPVDTGVHIGIDQSTLIVSKIGLRKHESRGDMHNEVWAGKTVNMASKLASLSKNDEIYVSPRFYENLKSNKALYSCKCTKYRSLWKKINLNNKRFSFNHAHILESVWCKEHGSEYLEKIIANDKC